jgi:hypothetical protein
MILFFTKINMSDIVDAWIEKNSKVKQHSDEWHEMRLKVVGGSEVATLVAHNPYCDRQRLMARKIGDEKFTGSSHTRWGNLFEYAIRYIVGAELCCEIRGDKCFHTAPPFSYSPDGIGVIENTEALARWGLGGSGDVAGPIIALFEFKCPASRQLNGKVPEYYIPQVEQGLALIDFCNFGIFAEAKFATTNAESMLEFGSNSISIGRGKIKKNWTITRGKNSKKTAAKWRGFICWSVDASTIQQIFKLSAEESEDQLIDLGLAGEDEFNNVIEQLEPHTPTYLITSVRDQMLDFSDDTNIVLPFVLTELDMFKILRNENFIATNRPILEAFIAELELKKN